ncbi:hypothetical protein BVRB_1g015030 [Beta vulgaris subsp. vulgaris]|nr:hypothetical protein BVRB_1g015030 [Beta vulgaris subsp. vulgaris]
MQVSGGCRGRGRSYGVEGKVDGWGERNEIRVAEVGQQGLIGSGGGVNVGGERKGKLV